MFFFFVFRILICHQVFASWHHVLFDFPALVDEANVVHRVRSESYKFSYILGRFPHPFEFRVVLYPLLEVLLTDVFADYLFSGRVCFHHLDFLWRHLVRSVVLPAQTILLLGGILSILNGMHVQDIDMATLVGHISVVYKEVLLFLFFEDSIVTVVRVILDPGLYGTFNLLVVLKRTT